jgi:hypothetical protein
MCTLTFRAAIGATSPQYTRFFPQVPQTSECEGPSVHLKHFLRKSEHPRPDLPRRLFMQLVYGEAEDVAAEDPELCLQSVSANVLSLPVP